MLFPFYDNNPTRRWPIVTILIIVANTVVFVWLVGVPKEQQASVYANYGFVPKRVQQLRDKQLVVEVDMQEPAENPGPQQKIVIDLNADPGAIYTSMFSYMFLHGGWLHLIGNMWFLWIFGNNIEDRLGHVIFLLFYIVVGLLAAACHWSIDQNSQIPIVGASGAVAGVLGAYAVTFPAAKVKTLIFVFIILFVELPALLVLFAWFGLQLLMGIQDAGNVEGVAWWAHVGGFLTGVLIMPLMALGAPDPGKHWEDEAEREFQV